MMFLDKTIAIRVVYTTPNHAIIEDKYRRRQIVLVPSPTTADRIQELIDKFYHSKVLVL